MLNYPLKFTPILKEKIWGGEKLNQILHKNPLGKNIGESWEIADVEEDLSVVANGVYKGANLKELLSNFKGDLVGDKVYRQFGDNFPLLIKYIDAKEALSIQLHPNDNLAKQRHNSFGKTEMWYVMQADENANLIVGFKKELSKNDYVDHLKNKTLPQILHTDLVKKGDVYFIPTGRVHAIGAGVLLAEIQQTSDVTYRIYDWDRQDDQGNYRELHTENALDAIDFKVHAHYKTLYETTWNATESVVHCQYFTTNIILLDKKMEIDHTNKDSFVIYMCVEGAGVKLSSDAFEEELHFGETVLVPSNVKKFNLNPLADSKLLEIYIP